MVPSSSSWQARRIEYDAQRAMPDPTDARGNFLPFSFIVARSRGAFGFHSIGLMISMSIWESCNRNLGAIEFAWVAILSTAFLIKEERTKAWPSDWTCVTFSKPCTEFSELDVRVATSSIEWVESAAVELFAYPGLLLATSHDTLSSLREPPRVKREAIWSTNDSNSRSSVVGSNSSLIGNGRIRLDKFIRSAS